jgi:hypothetical protein
VFQRIFFVLFRSSVHKQNNNNNNNNNNNIKQTKIMSLMFAVLIISISLSIASSNPYYEDCPRGSYRPSPTVKECKFCALGYYGNTHGLTTSTCTAACPIGKYGSVVGATNDEECTEVRNILKCTRNHKITNLTYCFQCPPGVVGLSSGLTTKSCSKPCPTGRYSSMSGSTSLKVSTSPRHAVM